MTPAIRIEGLSKVFPGRAHALRGVELEIARGEFVALLGPSGCGKSTLLRLIAGLEAPTEGSVSLAHAPRLSFVFQEAHLMPWRSALENVLLPLELLGERSGQAVHEAERLLERLGLGEFLHAHPHELSGGMKMRVSLARALITRPEVLLLDEPFGALDELTRHSLDCDLRSLWLATGMTVVFVTHSVSEAVFVAERVLVMTRRPARVLADEPVDLPRERDARTKVSQRFAALQLRVVEALEAAA